MRLNDVQRSLYDPLIVRNHDRLSNPDFVLANTVNPDPDSPELKSVLFVRRPFTQYNDFHLEFIWTEKNENGEFDGHRHWMGVPTDEASLFYRWLESPYKHLRCPDCYQSYLNQTT